ncbi:MAG: AraC family transcriptional regulator [Clostridia bacterium]|nr:AraC family transcriptional regulator [Clostridia bacterium]
MLHYENKKIDPKKNILYGSTSGEEFIWFTTDQNKKYPVVVETIGITHPDKHYFIKRKHSDYFVLEYVVSGKGYVTCNDEEYEVNEDCIYLLQPGTQHHYGADKKNPYQKIWINFFSSVFGDIFAAYGLSDKVIFKNTGCKQYFDELLQIAQKSSDNEKVYLQISKVLFAITLTLAKQIADNSEVSTTANLVKNALDNCLYRKITVEELAKEINVSKSQMTREFKKHFGTSPYKYLLDKKLAIAKHLLVATNMRIKEISDRLGFSDEYYFSNLFKERVGSSPRDYRSKKR